MAQGEGNSLIWIRALGWGDQLHGQVRNVLEVTGRVQVQVRRIRHAGRRGTVHSPWLKSVYREGCEHIFRIFVAPSWIVRIARVDLEREARESIKEVRGSNVHGNQPCEVLCVGIAYSSRAAHGKTEQTTWKIIRYVGRTCIKTSSRSNSPKR